MVDVINITDVPNDDLATTTDGYPDTSAHAYQMGVDQNLTEDEYWLHHNTTDVYQFFLNVTTDSETAKDEITRKEQSALTFVLRMFMWILSLFILTCNGLTIIVVMKYISYKEILEKRSILYALFLPIYAFKTCILGFCYLKIYLFLWKKRKTLASSQNSSNQQNFQKEKKTTVIIAIILTVYIVGTLPNYSYAIMIQKDPKLLNVEMWEFLKLVWYFTTLIDTFIYAWKVPEFQVGYRKILCCLRRSWTIQVAPQPNVQHHRMNIPLEPRREVDNSGDV